MTLKTRLDGRSKGNNSLQIKNSEGTVLAEVIIKSCTSVTLDINAVQGNYIEKPSGWKSVKATKEEI